MSGPSGKTSVAAKASAGPPPEAIDKTNPFARFVSQDELRPGPKPDLIDRFRINFEAGQSFTTQGTARDLVNADEASRFARRLEAFPEWQTWEEGAAALAGQFFGSAADPVNFVGVGIAEKIAARGGPVVGNFLARVFGGVTENALVNAAVDATLQEARVAGGLQEAFDSRQWFVSTLLGGAAGGTIAAAAPAARALGRWWRGSEDMPIGEALDLGAVRPAAEPARPAQPGEIAPGEAAPEIAPPARLDGPPAAEAAAEPIIPSASERPVSAAPAAPEAVLPPDPRAAVRPGGEGPAGEGRPGDAAAGAPVAGHPGAPEAKAGDEAKAALTGGRAGAAAFDEAGGKLARTAEGDLAAAPGTLRGQPGRAAAGVASADPVALPQLTRLHDLAAKLEEVLDLPAVRQGRLSVKGGGGAKALGEYDPRSGVIRVRAIDDFDTLAHEAGHHIEVAIGKPVKDLMRAHAGELGPLDYKPQRANLKEGFAEYLRLAMTNPAYAAKTAPGFDAAFRAMLAKDHAALGATIDDMARAFGDWIAQPSRAAVASTVVSARRPSTLAAVRSAFSRGFRGFAGTIVERLHDAYAAFFDDIFALGRSTRALAKIYTANTGRKLDLPAAGDPYKLARMARGAGASAMTDLQYGVRGYRSLQTIGPSLRDAIIQATGARNALYAWDDGKLQLFGSYLASRRLIGEWDRFGRGEIPNPPDKLTRGDHAVAVAEWEAEFPAFAEAAKTVHAYAQAIWQKKFDAGLITREQFEAGRAIPDYVPLQRRFDEDEAGVRAGGGGAGGGRDGKSDVVRRFRGSSRDIVNPLESLMADTFQTAGLIARNDAVRAMASLAKLAGNGGGRIAEAIPVREMKPMHVDPIEAAEAAARSAGLGTAETVQLRDTLTEFLGDAKALIFRPATTNERGEPIVFYREAGELRALRLADGKLGRDMMAAFNQMTRGEADALIRFLAAPVTVLRTGITTSLEFLGANAIRDMAQATILYGQPFKRLGATVAGGIDELRGRAAVRDYNAMGGIMGGANTAALRDLTVNRDIAALRKRGWAAQRLTSFKGVLEATELSETAARVGLMRTFKDEAMKRGLSEYEATFEAVWRARDYIDFDRRGSAMAALSRLIPFWNAALQGLDKVGRHTIAPLFRKGLTAEDGRDLARAAKSWAYLGMATVASTALYAVQGRDWRHEEISDVTRATHWTILWGDKWLMVPKPFEFAVVFNAGEAIYDAWAKGEPGQASRFLDDLWTATAPPSLLQGNPLIATAYELATGQNLFTGNPIVPESVQGMEPFMQWTAKTSELSKWLGRQFGVSPAVADHMIVSFLGSWGSNALALTDWATGAKGTPGWDDFAVTRRFIKDEARGSRSIQAFYDRVARTNGAMEMAASTYKALASGDPREAADFLATKDAQTRIYVAAAMMDTETRRAHPMYRARDAVTQINAVRRQIAAGEVETAEGTRPLGDAERTAADDILADLAMVEARDALILTGAPGWAGKEIVPQETYIAELRAVSPAAAAALADRYATARVRRFDLVAAGWGELGARLLSEGSSAETADLTAEIKAAGTELDGEKIGRAEKPEVPGLGP